MIGKLTTFRLRASDDRNDERTFQDPCPQLPNRLSEDRMPNLGGDLRKRVEYEPSVPEVRVGDRQFALVEDDVIKQQEVEIERPPSPA